MLLHAVCRVNASWVIIWLSRLTPWLIQASPLQCYECKACHCPSELLMDSAIHRYHICTSHRHTVVDTCNILMR